MEMQTLSAPKSEPKPACTDGDKQQKDSDKKRSLTDASKQQPQKKKPKRDPKVLDVRRRIQQCCASDDLHQAMEIYDQAQKDHVKLEAQSLYNLLSLCDGLDNRPVHIGTPYRTDAANRKRSAANEAPQVLVVDKDTRRKHAFRIKTDMDERKLALNETAYTALIRILAKAQAVDEANDLLKEAETTQQCKMRLRLYSSLLQAYCELGEMQKAIDLWSRLRHRKLLMTEREYCCLMQCATMTQNQNVMERVLSDLAEDVLIPSKLTSTVTAEWFKTDAAYNKSDDAVHIDLPESDAANMGPIVQSSGWNVDFGCTIDVNNGTLSDGCLKGEQLQPVQLSDEAWSEMMSYNKTIVMNGMMNRDASPFQGGGKGPKRKDNINADKKKREWRQFQEYLDKHYGDGLDVVIDGANVGYYKQNFQGAARHVNYNQIDAVVQHFLQQNRKVLLVMHARHFSPKLMPNWARPIVAKWSELLYKAAPGMNDDWFWLHAALWGGASTLMLTNDEMRDHHFQMLSPRSFVRWKERQQIHFSFEANRTPLLQFPQKYSRRIQRVAGGLVVPLTKRGDERRFLDGLHVASEDEPENETYLCIVAKAIKAGGL